jgi:hypothetical protein
MSLAQRITRELKAVALTTAYFAACFGVVMILKELFLAEYEIAFAGMSLAFVGAVVVAKVVLVLERVSLGSWIRRQPAEVDVVVRTVLYTLGALGVMLLEKAFESRHEYGGFAAALRQVIEHREIHHVWASILCVACALLGFNALAVVRRHVGDRELAQMFLTPLPE